jgi:mannonate dehydratase
VVTIDTILQAGAKGVVSALHHVPAGDTWTADEILRRQKEVGLRPDGTPSGLSWDVVESLPVSEDIKMQRGNWRLHIETYKDSLRNLARAGLKTVCYNFMPVLDWTRTDLAFRLPHGGTCMRFDLVDFAAFDLHILKRSSAPDDYAPQMLEEAQRRFLGMSQVAQKRLAENVTCGLPGAARGWDLHELRDLLEEYRGISPERLHRNLIVFLEEVVPTAETLGIRLCCHPDDPPFPLLGLPRIASTEQDLQDMLTAVNSVANGITLCSGSLGARGDNDLPGIMRRLGGKVHFLHLRNVTREDQEVQTGSFFEAEHLAGDTDMVALIAEVVREEERRMCEGRPDDQIPMRPDHGQDILDDLHRDAQPGYPAIGRLKGLAELRGVEAAISQTAKAV